MKRTTHLEPRFYRYLKNERSAQAQARSLGEQAWAEYLTSNPSAVVTADFENGFVEGFADYLYRGGNGEAPAVPPRGYWRQNFFNRMGKEKINEWFAGFRAGAQDCQARGIREMWVVPTSGTQGRDDVVGSGISSQHRIEPIPVSPMVQENTLLDRDLVGAESSNATVTRPTEEPEVEDEDSVTTQEFVDPELPNEADREQPGFETQPAGDAIDSGEGRVMDLDSFPDPLPNQEQIPAQGADGPSLDLDTDGTFQFDDDFSIRSVSPATRIAITADGSKSVVPAQAISQEEQLMMAAAKVNASRLDKTFKNMLRNSRANNETPNANSKNSSQRMQITAGPTKENAKKETATSLTRPTRPLPLNAPQNERGERWQELPLKLENQSASKSEKLRQPMRIEAVAAPKQESNLPVIEYASESTDESDSSVVWRISD